MSTKGNQSITYKTGMNKQLCIDSLAFIFYMAYLIIKYNINRLQRIQNSAARIVTNTRKYYYITPIFQKLH